MSELTGHTGIYSRLSPRIQSKPDSGFTLIELVMVIVILAIIAVIALPKFINLSQDANIATVRSVSGGFKSGINMARAVWATKTGSGPAENLPVFGTDTAGELDFNQAGWPAQHWEGGLEVSPKLDNVEDCLSIWVTLFQNSEPSASRINIDTEETDYKAQYLGSNRCRFNLASNPNLGVIYDSNSGQVSADLDPNS